MKNNAQFLIMGILLITAIAGIAWFLLSGDDKQSVAMQPPVQGGSELDGDSQPPSAKPSPTNAPDSTSVTNVSTPSNEVPTSELKVRDATVTSGPGVIEGVVTGLDDGAPVANAQVVVDHFVERHAAGRKPNFEGQWTTETDAQGLFRFTKLPVMEAFGDRASGFIVTASHDDRSATTITAVHHDEPYAVLELSLRSFAAITGRVLDESGTPINDVTVTPYEMIDDFSWASSQVAAFSWSETDEAGQFHLDNLHEGKWKLAATAEHFALSVSDPVNTGVSDAVIVLGRGASVRGTVLDADSGTPASGVSVIVAAVELPWRSELLQSSEDGTFVAESLPDGDHEIHVTDELRVQSGETLMFTIEGGAPVDGLTIHVAEGASIRGAVKDAENGSPIEGISIQAWPDELDYLERDLEATTDATGHYHITGVPAGRFSLNLLRAESYVTSGLKEDRVVSVSLGESLGGVDFALQRGVTLSGNTVDESGEPVAGLGIAARWSNGYGESVSTGQAGEFSVRGLPPHTQVTLEASGRGYTTAHQDPINTGDAGIEGITLTVEKGASISGIVVDEKGVPVSEIYVSAAPMGDGMNTSELNESDGTFKLTGMKAGVYQLEAESMGSSNSGKATAQELSLEKGESVTGVRIVLDKTPGSTISGRVTNAKGEPVEGAWVNANALQADSHGFAETAADGRYEVAVEAGLLYQMEVDHDDYSTVERDGIVAGEDDVNFVLEGHGTVEGQVLDAATGKPITNFEIAHSAGFTDNYDFYFLGYVGFSHAEGRFSIPDVEVGETTVHVRATGYGPGVQELANVKAGEITSGVQFRLPAGASIEGRVIDDGGAPIQGAQIHLTDGQPVFFFEEGLQNAVATSDAEGQFKINSLGEGLKSVTATHSTFPSTTVEVSLESGGTITVEIVMGAGGTVEGIVMANGAPAANQDVFLQTDNLADIRSATTDAAGFYTIARISPGDVSLSASVTLDGSTRHQEKTATVQANATTTLNFDVEFGSSAIEGTITIGGNPVAEAYISALLVEASDGLPINVDGTVSPDGTYRITGLDAGAYKLMVHTGFSDKSRAVDASVGEGETLHLDIDLSGGAHVLGIISGFSVADMCHVVAIRGKFEATDLESLMASPDMQSGAAGGSTVDASGAYDISGLEPGDYTVFVFQMDPSDMENPPFTTGTVSIDDSGTAELNLALP